jgi:hypothetical protein
MTDGLPNSPKFHEAREGLPEELRGVYDQMVADYSWCTAAKYGRGYVAYAVLADMVRMGWRPTESGKGSDI